MAELSLEQGLDVLGKRTRIARGLIVAYIATSAMTIVGAAGELAGAVDLEAAAPDAFSTIIGLAYLVFFIVLLASIIVIAMWIHRAHANLRAAGVEGLEFTPGWAVGWYFIPLANLFKPFQAMRELWNASTRQADSSSAESDPKLSTWWGLWVVGNIISNVSFRLGASAGAEGAKAALVFDIVSSLLLAAAAWFLLRIVTAVNSAQHSMVELASTFA